ncbi:hypothetical protein MP228_001542 [Amoeboaphelidium protococcarum]|nr:hypothetical protein MP228_001542 [Amoeboaphelidium protococcarum]
MLDRLKYCALLILFVCLVSIVQSSGTDQPTAIHACDINADLQCLSHDPEQSSLFVEPMVYHLMQRELSYPQALAARNSLRKYMPATSNAAELMEKANEADGLHLLMKQWIFQGKSNLVQKLQSKYITEQADPKFAEVVCGYTDQKQQLEVWFKAARFVNMFVRWDMPMHSCLKSALVHQNLLSIKFIVEQGPSLNILADAIADALHEDGPSVFDFVVAVENVVDKEWQSFWRSAWKFVPSRLCTLGDIVALKKVLDHEKFPKENGQQSSWVVRSIWQESFSRLDPMLWRYVISRRDLLIPEFAQEGLKDVIRQSTQNLIERGQKNGRLPSEFKLRMITMAMRQRNPESVAYLANCRIEQYDELMAYLQPENKYRQKFISKSWVQFRNLVKRRTLARRIKVAPVKPGWEQFCQDYRPLSQ